jgi:hypothetical protein
MGKRSLDLELGNTYPARGLQRAPWVHHRAKLFGFFREPNRELAVEVVPA